MKAISLLLALVFATSNIGWAATITDDTLKLGKPGSTANKEISLGTTRKIRSNATSGKLEFTNDGTVFKNLGSGSGSGDGGAPLFTNGSFEDGISTGWTSSGGTLSQGTYTNAPVDGDSKYAQFIATTSGQYFESTAIATADYMTGGCLAKVDYNTVSISGVWKIQVYDGSSNLLVEQSLDPKTWAAGYTSFKCPTVGTTVKVRVISTAAGTIQADHIYLGPENRTFQSSPSRYLGSIKYTGTANCAWSVIATTTNANYAADSDCSTPVVVSGNVQAPSTKIPAIVLPAGAPAGSYTFTAKALFYSSNAGVCSWRFSDGTNVSGPAAGYTQVGTAASGFGSMTGTINIPAALSSPLTVNIQTRNNNGTSQCIISSDTPDNQELSIEVSYQTNETQATLRPDTQDWMIDVNIGGADANLGVAAVSSYTGIESGVLDLVTNTGSAPAKIPCSSTNAATGSTCSVGNESLGVNFNIPQAGFYEVCGDFTHAISNSTSAGGATTFQWVETSNATQTIIQEGKSRTYSGQLAASGGANGYFPHHNCGTFYFAAAGEKTIRLMYEQSVTTSINWSELRMSRAATQGQNDTHIIVRPLLSAFNRPYMVEDLVKKAVLTGPSGASWSAGSFATMTLDTEQSDDYSLVTIASNQFTLGAGTYQLDVHYSVHRVDTYAARVQNITDGTTACNGLGGYASNTSATGTQATYSCIITIAAPKAFSHQVQPGATASASYYGTQIVIQKIK